VSKWVTAVGSFTVLSTEFSPMVKCLLTRLSVVAMIHSTPFFPKLVPESTFQELFSLI
jgi:hypothetical protein